jgi:hypothetical protein
MIKIPGLHGRLIVFLKLVWRRHRGMVQRFDEKAQKKKYTPTFEKYLLLA